MESGALVASIRLRPIGEADRDHLLRVYAASRADEGRRLAWAPDVWRQFIVQQFDAQHAQYLRSYVSPSFDLVLLDALPVGRLYVDRQPHEIRLVDIALLPEFRRRGIGGALLRGLLAEAQASGRYLGLHVARDNPILPYYRRLGLATAAERGVYLYLRSPGAVAIAAAPRERTPLPARQAFCAALHSDFVLRLAGGGDAATLRLEQVSDLGSGSADGFSLLFAGAATLGPIHENYEVSHPVLGCFPLFLGPVRRTGGGEICYQAIFSRLNHACILEKELASK